MSSEQVYLLLQDILQCNCAFIYLFIYLCITPAHLYRSLSNCFTVYRFILSAGVTELSENCMWPYGKMLSAVLQTFRLSRKRSIILAQTLRFLLGS